jgi:hypothetical protein
MGHNADADAELLLGHIIIKRREEEADGRIIKKLRRRRKNSPKGWALGTHKRGNRGHPAGVAIRAFPHPHIYFFLMFLLHNSSSALSHLSKTLTRLMGHSADCASALSGLMVNPS